MCLKYRKHFRYWLYEKVRLPMTQRKYHYNNLIAILNDIDENNEKPSRNSKQDDVKKLCGWLVNQMTNYKNKEHNMKNNEIKLLSTNYLYYHTNFICLIYIPFIPFIENTFSELAFRFHGSYDEINQAMLDYFTRHMGNIRDTLK